MFVVQASFVSLLQAVANRRSLPHVGFIHKIDPYGERLVGVELDLPLPGMQAINQRCFFWSAAPEDAHARDQAAFNAIFYIQHVFGFVVSDYGHESLFFAQASNFILCNVRKTNIRALLRTDLSMRYCVYDRCCPDRTYYMCYICKKK